MIPAGRTPLSTADIAKRQGRKTLLRGAVQQLPEPISRPGARTLIWDAEQIDAHLAGKPVPELPAGESPDDLLDREEARNVLVGLGVELKPEAWRAYINHGYAPEPDREIFGVGHWYRRTIVAWPDQRPGEGAGGGRPHGSKDSKPRDRATNPRLREADARKTRVQKMLADSNGRASAADIAVAEGISERQAYRLLTMLQDAAK